MSTNSGNSKMVAKKRPARTLKEIIEAANEGVEAPSEKARKVFLQPSIRLADIKERKPIVNLLQK